jgi:iron-sulfur cluster assembly protein
MSLQYVDGTNIDFGRDGLNEGLRFETPNVKDTCGCGESFSL